MERHVCVLDDNPPGAKEDLRHSGIVGVAGTDGRAEWERDGFGTVADTEPSTKVACLEGHLICIVLLLV
jgi:hypothetical protein